VPPVTNLLKAFLKVSYLIEILIKGKAFFQVGISAPNLGTEDGLGASQRGKKKAKAGESF